MIVFVDDELGSLEEALGDSLFSELWARASVHMHTGFHY